VVAIPAVVSPWLAAAVQPDRYVYPEPNAAFLE
jgi:hypothetical protein